ncbi:MAG: chalcone isomerase family protein [Gammaproteobacteria bacterium]|nr:chalcone isomerase family protein [Gammaproteobacteria bacterium]
MMWRARLVLALTCLAVTALAAARSDGEGLQIDERWLTLKAQARACYLGFIELYDAAYFRSDTSTPAKRCIQVDYRRSFSAAALDKATNEVFRERHGAESAARYAHYLAQVGDVYRAVEAGDRYTYCLDDNAGGVLWRDGKAVVRFDSHEFSERFMQIWVAGETADARPRWAFPGC